MFKLFKRLRKEPELSCSLGINIGDELRTFHYSSIQEIEAFNDGVEVGKQIVTYELINECSGLTD